jgi:hypothetical protein
MVKDFGLTYSNGAHIDDVDDSVLTRLRMHFWREKYFQTLKDIAAEARTVPGWADYAAFLRGV